MAGYWKSWNGQKRADADMEALVHAVLVSELYRSAQFDESWLKYVRDAMSVDEQISWMDVLFRRKSDGTELVVDEKAKVSIPIPVDAETGDILGKPTGTFSFELYVNGNTQKMKEGWFSVKNATTHYLLLDEAYVLGDAGMKKFPEIRDVLLFRAVLVNKADLQKDVFGSRKIGRNALREMVGKAFEEVYPKFGSEELSVWMDAGWKRLTLGFDLEPMHWKEKKKHDAYLVLSKTPGGEDPLNAVIRESAYLRATEAKFWVKGPAFEAFSKTDAGKAFLSGLKLRKSAGR